MSKLHKVAMKTAVLAYLNVVDPVAAALAAAFDALTDDRANETIRRDIARLREDVMEALGSDPALVKRQLGELMAFARTHGHASHSALRHAASCLAVMEAISTRSRDGLEGDPQLGWAEVEALLSALPGVDDPKRESKLVVRELERTELATTSDDPNAPQAWGCLMPTDAFFWKTDGLFRPWRPDLDARTLCSRGDADGILSVRKAAADLSWGARRMNPALSFLLDHDMGEAEESYSDPYRCPAVYLNAEAEFYAEEE